MIRRRSLFARTRGRSALAFLLLLAACGPFRRTPPGDEVIVTFVNESQMQADLFAVSSAGTRRLATVQAGRTEQIIVPESVVITGGGGVNFVARLFPRRNTLQSGRVTVLPGDRFTVRLPSTANVLAITPSPGDGGN
jgi:hypothetical protein